jgi:alpha-2-macroglobulin
MRFRWTRESGRKLARQFVNGLRRFPTLFALYWVRIFGSWSWQKPAWIDPTWKRLISSRAGKKLTNSYLKCKKWVQENPRRSAKIAGATLGFVAIALTSAYFINKYIESLPQPDYVSISTSSPSATDPVTKQVDHLIVRFSKSAARLEAIGKEIKTNIPTISPEIKGTWIWMNDRSMEFTPTDAVAFKTDWLVGETYTIKLDKKLFPSHLIFDSYKTEFTTTPLTTSFYKNEFYIDPINTKVKKALFTIHSSHPFDSEDLKRRIKLDIRTADDFDLSKEGKTLAPNISFNPELTEAYIETSPLEMTGPDQVVTLTLNKGLSSLRGGQPTATGNSANVRVPGRFNAFKVNDPKIIFARNEKFEPEQILVFGTGVGVKTEEIAKTLKVYVLPVAFQGEKDKKVNPHYPWTSPSEVTSKALANSTPVQLEVIPGATPFTETHSFKLKIPVNRKLYFYLPKGIKALGDYELGRDYANIVHSPDYQPELMFMSEGAILTQSGDKKLPLLARNLSEVDYSIARIIPTQVNFLISRMFSNNSFTQPQLYADVEDLIIERFNGKQKLHSTSKTETQYFALDMAPFHKEKQGFYLVTVSGQNSTYSSSTSKAEGDENSGESEDGNDDENPFSDYSDYESQRDYRNLKDKRLVLITDLGLIAKHTSADTTIVYVQNLRSGLPVENALVEVIGKNGISIVSQNSDVNGRVNFPSLKSYTNEKKPLAIVAHHNGDASYLPFQMSQRMLTYSRFNTGGEEEYAGSDELSAMIFSDRGLYRPGDSINLGIILRSKTPLNSIDDLPLEIAVTDPRGVKVTREKLPIKLFGLQDFSFSTRQTSPAGTYNIQLILTKKSKNKSVRQIVLATQEVQVEEFVPDKLKILAQFIPAKSKGWLPLGKMKASVNLKNLFGTAAENRNVRSQLSITPASLYVDKFKDYRFGNPNKNDIHAATQDLEPQTTDEKGDVSYDIDLSQYKGYFSVRLRTMGYEAEGGRGVEATTSVLASHWSSLVGYKADGSLNYITKGAVRNVKLIALNSDLQPTEAEVQIALTEVKYVSTLVKQNDRTYKYQSLKKEVPIKTENRKISAQGLQLTLPTDTAGDFIYVVQNKDGEEINRLDFKVIGEANLTRSLDRNAELQIVLNKDDYQPGEDIELQILAPYKGAGLITIEREGVFVQKWFKTQSNTTVERIKIPETLSGNAYVNVTFLRAIDSKEIYMSPLSYGVQPFSVSLDKQRTKIDLVTPEKVKPGEELQIRYTASRATSIIIYGVDEGILQVAHYQLPNPIQHFFRKRALQVQTFQLLDLLLPEYSLVNQTSSPGGDSSESEALGGNLNPFKAKSQKPVVFWSGVLEAGEKTKIFTYKVPDYFNGNIKVMAVASSKGGLGSTEKGALSRGDFIITPTAPIFVTPSDEIQVGVNISNQIETPNSSTKVKVKTTTSDHLSVMGSAEQILDIAQGHELGTSFRFKANNKLGVADLEITASNGKESASFHHEVSLRPAIPYITTINAGITDTYPIELSVDRKMHHELSSTDLSISPMPLSITDGLISYLNEFPHGCTEQVVSQTIPSLVLSGHTEFKDAVRKSKTAHENLLNILRARQTSDGGFVLYEGNSDVHLPASLYAINYLVNAKDVQLPTPPDMEAQILSFLKTEQLRSVGSLTQARRFALTIYLQARYGIVPTNDLNYLLQTLEKSYKGKWEQDSLAIYLAGTYQLLQQADKGWELLKNLKIDQSRTYDYENYYDPTVRDALLINVVAKHYPKHLLELFQNDSIKALLKPIMSQHYNTVNSAQLILALASISANATKVDFPGSVQVKELLSNSEHLLTLSKGILARAKVDENAKKVLVIGPGPTPLFYSLTQKGFDSPLPTKEMKKSIEVVRTLEDKEGKNITQVKMGDELTMVLRLRGLEAKHIPYIVLVELFPAGFELQRESVSGSAEFIDKREDRLVVYTSVSGEVSEYRYKLKATHKGKYILPPTFGESMYDKDIQYRGVSGKIEVL